MFSATKRARRFSQKLSKYPLFRIIILSIIFGLVVYLVYDGVSIRNLGIYSDDWERIHLYEFNKKHGFKDKAVLLSSTYPGVYYRIAHLVVIPASSVLGDLVSSQILGMHLVSFILNFFLLIVLYNIVYTIVPKTLPALLFSMFIFTMPGRSSTFFWPSTQVEIVSMILLFSAIAVHLSSRFRLRNSFTTIFILSLLSVWSYEITSFMFLLFLYLYFYEKEKRTFMHFISSLSGVSMSLFYKFFIYPVILNLEVVKNFNYPVSLTSAVVHVFQVIGSLFSKVSPSAIFEYWYEYNHTWFLVVVVVLLFVFFIFFSYTSLRPNKKYLPLLLIGLALISTTILSIALAEPGDVTFSVFGKHSRFTALPSIGLGFVLCYVFSLLLSTHKISVILVFTVCTVFLVANLNGINSERIAYVKSWSLQQDMLNSIDFDVVKDVEKAFIFVHGVDHLRTTTLMVPVFDDFWTLTYAFSLATNNINIEADFAHESYDELKAEDGFRSENWDKKYYLLGELYEVNLYHNNPEVTAVFSNNAYK